MADLELLHSQTSKELSWFNKLFTGGNNSWTNLRIPCGKHSWAAITHKLHSRMQQYKRQVLHTNMEEKVQNSDMFGLDDRLEGSFVSQ